MVGFHGTIGILALNCQMRASVFYRSFYFILTIYTGNNLSFRHAYSFVKCKQYKYTISGFLIFSYALERRRTYSTRARTGRPVMPFS